MSRGGETASPASMVPVRYQIIFGFTRRANSERTIFFLNICSSGVGNPGRVNFFFYNFHSSGDANTGEHLGNFYPSQVRLGLTTSNHSKIKRNSNPFLLSSLPDPISLFPLRHPPGKASSMRSTTAIASNSKGVAGLRQRASQRCLGLLAVAASSSAARRGHR